MDSGDRTKNVRQLTKNFILSLTEDSRHATEEDRRTAEELRKHLPYKGLKMTVYYRRPVTIVILDEKQGRIGVGWAKVCRPDKWREERGKDIALGKAAQDLSEAVYSSTVQG